MTPEIHQPMQRAMYQALSIKELYSRLASCIRAGENVLIEGSRLLAELHRRGEYHPLMRDGLFRWFKEIDEEILDASAVVKFAGQNDILKKLIRTPLSQQIKIAETGKIMVAEQDKAGNIIEAEKPILTIPTKQLDRVFGDKGIRTVAQQTKLLKAAPPPKPATIELVRADAANGVLVIAGRHNIEPNALIEPLRRLGFKLVKA
jgi:hypothetical protein